jgi:hypothetical protein
LDLDHPSAFFFKWQWLGHLANTWQAVGPNIEPGQDSLPLDIPVAFIIPLRLAPVQNFFLATKHPILREAWSFPRKRESSPWTVYFRLFAERIPAFAGMTCGFAGMTALSLG